MSSHRTPRRSERCQPDSAVLQPDSVVDQAESLVNGLAWIEHMRAQLRGEK